MNAHPMNTRLSGLLALVTLLLAAGLPLRTAAGDGKSTAATVAAAKALLSTLDDSARARLVFNFGDEKQRKRWSNLPTGIYQRAGLRLGELSKAQREAALAVLAAALSRSGYEKVLGIMEGDETLRKGGGGGPVFGRDEYYLSFVGKPSETDPWTIQFGGHHLALNVTLAGAHGTLAPSHTGTQPARFTLDGKLVRPLGEENDQAFALVNALDEEQRKAAILGAEFRDLVLGPDKEYRALAPEGVKASTFSEKQKAQLLSLIQQWVGILPDEAAAAKIAEVKAGLNETWFAWSGPTKPGSASYFRIQGPAVHIEYAPQKLGGDATQHIHTIYRDPTNEYGRRWWKE